MAPRGGQAPQASTGMQQRMHADGLGRGLVRQLRGLLSRAMYWAGLPIIAFALLRRARARLSTLRMAARGCREGSR